MRMRYTGLNNFTDFQLDRQHVPIVQKHNIRNSRFTPKSRVKTLDPAGIIFQQPTLEAPLRFITGFNTKCQHFLSI